MKKKLIIEVSRPKCSSFWHFMMGEFLPIISIILESGCNLIYLNNCKRKWDRLFDIFYKELPYKIYFTNKKKDDKNISHDRWDLYLIGEKDKKRCENAVNFLKRLSKKKYGLKTVDNNEILCLYRKNGKLNKLQKAANGKKYGAERRSFQKFRTIHTIVDNIKYINTDDLPLLKQISCFIGYDKIILEHGAGMFFCLFMNENTKIIEYIYKIQNPNRIPKLCGAFQGLIRVANLKKFKLKRIVMEENQTILDKKIELFVKSYVLF